ncbi:uncharacterized protein PHACADRAFT_145251, partial [Phanerochaete carnosa HHB-10118-sp]
MTNVPSGSKRPWDGSPELSHKRPRSGSRGWRDAHLGSPRGKPPADRRDSADRRKGDYGVGSRDHERRSGDYSRDRRDGRHHDRERSRDHHHRRHDSRREELKREAGRHGFPRQHPNGNGTARPEESEKEEGEISPHHSPTPPERRSRPSHAAETSSPHIASAPAPEPEQELDLATPPPIEETLAARRAKRQAILAKYAGSINTAPTATPSPEPSSAAEPPTATSAVSDHTSSRLQSVAVTPPPSVTPGASVTPDGKLTPPK